MAQLTLIVKDKLSGEEFEVEADDGRTIGEIAEGVRKQLGLPDVDQRSRSPLSYKLLLLRTGKDALLLPSNQTLRQAGLKDQDVLSFWGEPTAAAAARLESEYRIILERFGNHPKVKVEPIGGRPPKQYRVTYLLRAPTALRNGSLVVGERHVLHIAIPEEYPATSTKPSFRMDLPICHPNINSTTGTVCIGGTHFASQSIADDIAKVGNYLQYREFGLANPFNREVATWLRAKGWTEPGDIPPFDDVYFGI